MALTKIDDRGLKTPIDLLDNEKIRFGTGNDLEIYHDGTDSYLTNTTNDLYIKSTGDDIWIQAADNIMLQAQGSEHGIIIYGDGGVDLYYDGSKKFETTSWGTDVTGKLRADTLQLAGDDQKLQVGASDDLEIYHTSGVNLIQTHGNSNLEIKHGSDVGIKSIANDSVELYYDGTRKLETFSSGVQLDDNLVIKDSKKAFFGDGYDLQIYHDGSNYLKYANGNLIFKNGTESDANCTQFDTNGDLYVPDDGMIYFGGAPDLKIYHSGSHSYIKDSGTGALNLCASALYVTNAADSEVQIAAIEDGAVSLYYDGSKKLETTSTGAILTSGAANTTSVRFGNTANRGLEIKTYNSAGNNDSGVVFNAADSENSGYAATLEFDLGGVEFGRFDGNYDIFKLGSACNGITFNGDWAAANRLNDYEEGTWTGAVMDGNTNGRQNISVNNVVATYRKIGKQVTCWFNITRNETGSRTGQIRFNDSLPFTSASGMNVIVAGSWWLDEGGVSSGDSVGGSVYIVNNSTQGVFVHPTNDSQQAPTRYLEFSQWSNNRPIYGFFTYYVD